MRAKTLFLSTAAIFPAAFVASPLAAQSVTLDPPPLRQPLDENGVDLSSGDIVVPSSTIAIGGGDGLVHSRSRVGNGWRHNYILSVTKDPFLPGTYIYTIQIGGSARQFVKDTNGDFVPESGERGTMSETAGEIVYTSGGGTEYRFSKSLVANGESYYEDVEAVGTLIEAPNGAKTTLTYKGGSYTLGSATIHTIRLQSVTNNASYQLKFGYETNTLNSSTVDDWYQIDKVTAINNAEEYCDPAADSCSLTGAWPYLDYAVATLSGVQVETVTDILGRVSWFRNDSSERLTGVKRPSETTYGMDVAYDANSRVSSVTHQGSYTRNYSWTLSGTELTAVASDSLGRTRTTVADTNHSLILSSEDALGNTTDYTYDTDQRLTEITAPEGNKTVVTRDDRGRVTEVRQKAKPGSGLADIVTSATYPALTSAPASGGSNIYCNVDVTCDSPLTTTDARGKVTDYTYDQTHGGVLTAQLPADSAGVRPKSTIAYASEYARIRNSSGTLVQAADPITKPVSVKRCRVGASCSGTANEQVVEVDYDNLQAENLQPVTITRKAGDGTLAAASKFTYTPLGQVETVDGPLAGAVDLAKNRYDDAGQLTGTIAPDPDGSGSNPHLATRLTYNLDGQVTERENGTVTGLTETDWTNFTGDTRSVAAYDAFGRVKTSAHVDKASSTQYSIAQYGYDAAGRLQCTAQRMNAPSTTTALPADACTVMTAGANGEDRITKRFYDTADRVTEVWSGFGTSLAQQTAEISYTNNGRVAWVEDAEDNRTEYTQDGFDRNVRITYPSKTTAHTADASDYEAITYDAGGNILTHRTRAGETFAYTYDNLGRVTHKDVPTRAGLAATHTRDVYYGYDLNGGLLYANFDSPTGEGLSFTYNALGQLVSATSDLDSQSRTLSYQYDVAGRRTRITHPDNNYWTNYWDNLGRLTMLRDQGNNVMVSNTFWSGGQPRQFSRHSSAPDVVHRYDTGMRLDEMFTNHPTSTYDVTHSWTLNPAGQVADESVSNNLFASHALPTSNLAYTANGLNQYTQVGSNALSYDTNGNLTSDSNTSYVYDTENRLVSASGQNSATLRYDPFGRLYEVADGSNTTRFLYDGDALVGEYNASGTLLQRYVHGPGAGDDPLIRYPGTSIAKTNAHFLYGDRLGSIVQQVKADGTQTALNTYDAYGVPGPSSGINNTGRFRYTGQVWLEELGMYYYKARMYSPTLGRFMQTDPIGYSDGMNIYAYVGNDPMNFVDPTGLSECPTGDDEDCDDQTDTYILVQALRDAQARDGFFAGFNLSWTLETPIVVIGVPFQGPELERVSQIGRISNAAAVVGCSFGEAAETVGNLGADVGLVGAVVGGAAGSVIPGVGTVAGASPGLSLAAVGGTFASGGEALQDISSGKDLGTTGSKLIGNLILGRLASRVARGVDAFVSPRAAAAISNATGVAVDETLSFVANGLDEQGQCDGIEF